MNTDSITPYQRNINHPPEKTLGNDFTSKQSNAFSRGCSATEETISRADRDTLKKESVSINTDLRDPIDFHSRNSLFTHTIIEGNTYERKQETSTFSIGDKGRTAEKKTSDLDTLLAKLKNEPANIPKFTQNEKLDILINRSLDSILQKMNKKMNSDWNDFISNLIEKSHPSCLIEISEIRTLNEKLLTASLALKELFSKNDKNLDYILLYMDIAETANALEKIDFYPEISPFKPIYQLYSPIKSVVRRISNICHVACKNSEGDEPRFRFYSLIDESSDIVNRSYKKRNDIQPPKKLSGDGCFLVDRIDQPPFNKNRNVLERFRKAYSLDTRKDGKLTNTITPQGDTVAPWDGLLYHGTTSGWFSLFGTTTTIEANKPRMTTNPSGFYTDIDPLYAPKSYACSNPFPHDPKPIGYGNYIVEVDAKEANIPNDCMHFDMPGWVLFHGNHDQPPRNIKVNKVYQMDLRVNNCLHHFSQLK